MSSKVIITCDSTCDFSEELVERYSLTVYPLVVNLGDKSFRDCVDITPDEIYANYDKTGILPKTAAVSPGAYIEFFKKFVDDGCEVIHFNLSSKMSATHNNARLAASELSGVYVVDTKNLSTGSALLVIKAREMLDSGMSAEETAAKVSEMTDKVRASFVINKLEYLHKGGRCSGVAALGANLLKLKPTIEVKDGAMVVGKKYRGKYEAILPQYAEEMLSVDNIDYDRVFITHSGLSNSECVDLVKAKVAEVAQFKEVLVTRAGCTISSHCGKDTLGVLFMIK